jgi:hypothetical protein
MALLGFLGKVFGAKKRHDAQVHAHNVNSENAARDREFQKDMMRETNAHQIKLNRETHERNLELYERQRDDQATRLQTMVADANAAGINPITALRGGASAASATPAPMEQVPILSHGSFTPTPLVTPDFANADMWEGIGEEADRWFQERRSRQHDEEMAELQKEVLQEQVKAMKSRNSVATSPYFGLGMPHANTTARIDTHNGNFGSRSDDGLSRSDGIRVGAIPITESENNSDAADFEQRYGDVAAAIYGIGVLGGDIKRTIQDSALATRVRGAANRVSSTFERLRNWRPTTYHDLPPPPLSRSVPKGLRGDRARRRHPHYK